MNLVKAAAKYKRMHVETSPARILDALLRRLLHDMEDARIAIESKDMVAKGAAVGHALAILAELSAALDHDAAPELCANLRSLYVFAEERLVAGNAKMDGALIAQAVAALEPVSAAFSKAAGG
jgi:flagellar biosynthetic protein FliS